MNNSSIDIELFKAYGDIIVDILRDTSFEDYERTLQNIDHNVPFGSDIWDYFKKHESTFKILTLRYLEIQELVGNTEKLELKNNQYNKYINGLRKKKIGMVKDESILDSKDKLYWQRQNLFKAIIIEENVLKRYQNSKCEYYYVTVDDVLKFFSGELESRSLSGEDLYENFLNENDEYDFTLTYESVGKYINSIKRFFQKKRIRYDGNRLNIYCMVN